MDCSKKGSWRVERIAAVKFKPFSNPTAAAFADAERVWHRQISALAGAAWFGDVGAFGDVGGVDSGVGGGDGGGGGGCEGCGGCG